MANITFLNTTGRVWKKVVLQYLKVVIFEHLWKLKQSSLFWEVEQIQSVPLLPGSFAQLTIRFPNHNSPGLM